MYSLMSVERLHSIVHALNSSYIPVCFPSLGSPLHWIMDNFTTYGKSLGFLSESALKMIQVRADGSNESAVSCYLVGT